MQAGVVGDLKARVVVINQLADQIAQINGLIAKTKGTGHEPNDLLDQRERLISTSAPTSPSPRCRRTTAPWASSSAVASAWCWAMPRSNWKSAPTPTTPPRPRSICAKAPSCNLDASVLTGGAVTALLAFQNEDLTDARNMLGQLAASFGTHINTQNGLGLDLSTHPARAPRSSTWQAHA